MANGLAVAGDADTMLPLGETRDEPPTDLRGMVLFMPVKCLAALFVVVLMPLLLALAISVALLEAR